ncbi:MAG: PDGLE domain-containing protein [Archaeoglobus sp.]|nr:PDGLE domain-containing protein [Archaeoglobus sp.]
MFSKKFWIVLGVLIILSPLFAYAADLVGYSEPLENIAEKLGAEEKTLYEGILPDYSVPGLDMTSGTLISAVVGALITMGVAFGVAKVISR